jgi:hypothetical protein
LDIQQYGVKVFLSSGSVEQLATIHAVMTAATLDDLEAAQPPA